jgi:hypothetical protein
VDKNRYRERGFTTRKGKIKPGDRKTLDYLLLKGTDVTSPISNGRKHHAHVLVQDGVAETD